MKFRLSIVSVAALALAACGSQEEQAAEAPAAQETAAVAPEASAEPDPATPQGFVTLAASSDLYEIEAGRLAERMGRSDQVKEFGAQMVADHTASSDKLKSAVAAAGNGTTVPVAMLPQHRRDIEALRSAADNFDSLYAQQQVAAHEEALTLLQGQAESGTVPSLKAFAAETAPVVEGHLGHARELADAAGGA